MNKKIEQATEEHKKWKNKKIIVEYGIADEGEIVQPSDLEGGAEDGKK
ncbi:hypothetical protein [Fusobacterium sp.]|nr:hypothetical protein [Fusobacterium sp.]MDU1912598.1 hypothetical protein [Fusobacterium sp.]